MKNKKSILLHFSGGSDSTLAAAFCAEEFDKVYLITYNRFSFRGADSLEERFDALCNIYGKNKFNRISYYPIGSWYKALAYNDYINSLKKNKTIASCPCVSCKLSMHWHSVIFCLQNGINHIADGTVPYMDIYPDQNREITTNKLIDFYKTFGIEYLTPVYDIAEKVEQRLYDKGVTLTPKIRGTEKDKQVYCAEQSIFAFFVKYHLSKGGKESYEKALSKLTKEKIDYMTETVSEFCKNPKLSTIYLLLTKDEQKKANK